MHTPVQSMWYWAHISCTMFMLVFRKPLLSNKQNFLAKLETLFNFKRKEGCCELRQIGKNIYFREFEAFLNLPL